VVQRLVPVTVRREHNDVAGFIYAVLGVIYAVLLALVVIAVWEQFDRARITVEMRPTRWPRSSGLPTDSRSLSVASSSDSPRPTRRRW
jgi:hypothetical protein